MRAVPSALAALACVTAAACAAVETTASDPVVLGMRAEGPAFYDDGQTTIYQVTRPVSLPLVAPGAGDLVALSGPHPPFARAPWISERDVKVEVAWTLSNLDAEAHNAEILIDPWNEFARYVPALNIGEEEAVPDLSGIQLLTRVEGLGRRSGTFTFADMDELATDLATAQNLLALQPESSATGASLNAMINHAFDLQNRTGDGDKLLARWTPPDIPGLVGFDLGLRTYARASIAIEVVVELRDEKGNRVKPDASLGLDGTMWITPEANISAPMGEVR